MSANDISLGENIANSGKYNGHAVEEITPTLVDCPACGMESFFHRGMDRYVHFNGTRNELCWAHISSGRHDFFAPNQFDVEGPERDKHQGDEPDATTWEPVDLTDWLNGNNVSPQADVGISRTDGQKMLYPGREHVVFGETESGKSWFALECVATEIRMGRDVVYIHFEEGDPASTIERLRLLGLTPAQILKHLRFAAPARPVRGDWLAPLLNPPPVLAVIDGVNEGMSLHGDDTNATDGAATFRRTIVKPFLAAGATTLSCDHVTKSGGDNRGRYSMGSAHKINAADGAAILMENIEPFGRNLRGASRVSITKDRPGQLRAHGQPTNIPGKTFMGILAIDATGNTPDFIAFHPPKDTDPAARPEPDDDLATQMHQTLTAQPGQTVKSGNQLRAAMRAAGIKFTNTAARNTLDDLVYDGRFTEVPGRGTTVGYQANSAPKGVSDQRTPPSVP